MPLRITAELQAADNVTADNVTNTFHFASDPGPSSGDVLDTMDLVANFYSVAIGAHAVDYYISKLIKRTGGLVLRAYDLGDAPPRAPIAEVTYDLNEDSNAAAMPPQVAACISYKGSYAGAVEFGFHSRPRASKRGRLYIGPLNISAIPNEPASGRAGGGFLLILNSAAAQLVTDSADILPWCVYSRVHDSVAIIEEGWSDYSLDTQRRRHFKTASKEPWLPA